MPRSTSDCSSLDATLVRSLAVRGFRAAGDGPRSVAAALEANAQEWDG